MSGNLNIWGLLWKVASGKRVAKLMLGIFSWSVLESGMKHCLYLFLCMAETMLWKEKERSRIMAVQMDNFRGLLDR